MKNPLSYTIRKIAAFTILEMVVVMLLTAMVVTIAFKSLEITLQNFQRQKTNDSALAKFALLDRLLTTDVHRSLKVTKFKNGFKCLYANGKLVEYITFPEAIIRNQGVVLDTFNIENSKVALLFENKATMRDNQLIDSISIDYLYKGISLSSSYTKVYTSDMLQSNDTKPE